MLLAAQFINPVVVVVVGGLFISGLVLLALLLANRKTRGLGIGLGIALCALCGVALAGVFVSTLYMNLSHDRAMQARTQAQAQAVASEQDALHHRAMAEEAFDKLTKPRINLEDGSQAAGKGDKRSVAVEAADGKMAILTTDAPTPAWVTSPPLQTAGSEKKVVVLTLGPYGSPSECLRVEGLELVGVARQYVRDSVADSHAIDQLGMSTSELVQRFAKQRHLSKNDTSVMEVYTLHTLVEFDQQGGDLLVSLTLEENRVANLARITFAAGGVLTLLAGVFGLLKLDEATRGYYTGRLLLGVPVALVSIILLLSLLA